MNCSHTGMNCTLACGCDWNDGRMTSKAEACVRFESNNTNEVSCDKCQLRASKCSFACFRLAHRGMIQFVDRIVCGDGREDAKRMARHLG